MVTIGLEDIVIVDTDDVLLVCRRDRSQEVRAVVEQLKAAGEDDAALDAHAMVIVAATIDLDLPGIASLKEKRSVLKSLIARLHKVFNIAVAEVDLHDVWQSAALGVAIVSTQSGHAEAMLENVYAGSSATGPT